MKKAFGLFAAGVASISVFGAIAVYGQQGSSSSNPGASASPGVLYPCPLATSSPGATVSPGATPAATASPGATLQCITIAIPQGAVGMGPAAYGTNPQVIPPGTTVTWTNNDTVAHTVTADDNSFDSGTLQPGQSYTRTFAGIATGASVPYHCSIHGAASMSGALQIQGNAGTAPSPSATPSASPSQSAGIAGGTVPVSSGGTGY
jgi:plastocyanin